MGIVYALKNRAMPGLIKIGMTGRSSLKSRMDELYGSSHTGVPAPFECVRATEVDDHKWTENKLHGVYASRRYNPNREFFEITESDVEALFDLLDGEDITDSVNQTLEEDLSDDDKNTQKKGRTPTLFITQLGIPMGAEIVLKWDPNIKCRIVSDTEVEYEGVIEKLSPLSKRVHPKRPNYDLDGIRHWTYNGKLLNHIKRDVLASLESGTE